MIDVIKVFHASDYGPVYWAQCRLAAERRAKYIGTAGNWILFQMGWESSPLAVGRFADEFLARWEIEHYVARGYRRQDWAIVKI